MVRFDSRISEHLTQIGLWTKPSLARTLQGSYPRCRSTFNLGQDSFAQKDPAARAGSSYTCADNRLTRCELEKRKGDAIYQDTDRHCVSGIQTGCLAMSVCILIHRVTLTFF